MIEVKIKRVEQVSEDAARQIANAAFEWLDANNLYIKKSPGTPPRVADLDYEGLAEKFVEDWG